MQILKYISLSLRIVIVFIYQQTPPYFDLETRYVTKHCTTYLKELEIALRLAIARFRHPIETTIESANWTDTTSPFVQIARKELDARNF